jgi:quercetin dioxygenase-like cupin family protein
MKHDRLETMFKGWFVGDFDPVALRSPHCEVSIKHYAKGDHEGAHYHAVATELTAIVTGRVRMMGREWGAGDIITVEPGETTDFEALTDSITVVVKTPSLTNDKFVVES